jgi:subtilisin-like proprotein convertase family protein
VKICQLKKRTTVTLFFILLFSLFPRTAVAAPLVPSPDPENNIQTGSAGIATGDPNAAHATYAWPFPIQQMGHLNSSYQLYSEDPVNAYFHHGIDMLADDGTPVYTPFAGQVVNIENYNYPLSLYWEVAILDPEGYVWQYHHIEQASIPAAIHQAYSDYQANPETGGFISANSHLGDIVWWTEVSNGYRFNHIHLNILGDGDVYLNPLEFLDNTYWDTQAPQIQKVGLFTGTNNLLTGNVIPFGTDYSLYVQTRDLFMSQVFYLPPQRVTYKLDGSNETQVVWDFHALPGGASESAYVNQYFLPGKTRGDYDYRDFYIDLGFSKEGNNPLPIEPGLHSIDIEVWDYAYNRAAWKYNWVITQPLADNGCASGQGVSFTTEVSEDSWVEDLDLGLLVAHEARGELKVTLKGPQQSTPVTLIAPSSDADLNYNILIDDASSNPIDNNRRDDLTPPYFKRSVGPLTDGSLVAYNDGNAQGTWQVFICDSKPGNIGLVYDLDLRLELTTNRRPTANDQTVYAVSGIPLPVVLSGTDPDGDELTYTILTQPAKGSLEGNPPGLVYTAEPHFTGTDAFTFTVSDGERISLPATMTVVVFAQVYLPLMLR